MFSKEAWKYHGNIMEPQGNYSGAQDEAFKQLRCGPNKTDNAARNRRIIAEAGESERRRDGDRVRF
jgi:hypothetical protein